MLAKPVKSERRVELQARNEFFKISLLNISLGGGRSILLSYGRIGQKLLNLVPPGSDVQLLRRRMLYPAELRRHRLFILPVLSMDVNKYPPAKRGVFQFRA